MLYLTVLSLDLQSKGCYPKAFFSTRSLVWFSQIRVFLFPAGKWHGLNTMASLSACFLQAV